MEAIADKLTEARFFKPDTQNLCRLALVRPGNPRASGDVIYFTSATDKQTSIRALCLAKLARLALGSLEDRVP
eukprot:14059799-Alexandrium_andersonii.AAC.1